MEARRYRRPQPPAYDVVPAGGQPGAQVARDRGSPVLPHEVHGAGDPLLLLHGGRVADDPAYGLLLPVLARLRRVVAVDVSRGDATTDDGRPVGYASMADSVATLVEHLGLGSADIVGYALGGAVALRLAICHPSAVRRLVVASALVGWPLDGPAAESAQDEHRWVVPVHRVDGGAAAARHAWTSMVAPLRPLPVPDAEWAATFSSIPAPMLLLDGDLDGVRPARTLEMFRMLGGEPTGSPDDAPGSRWTVLPATARSASTIRADRVPHIVAAFLDSPCPIAA